MAFFDSVKEAITKQPAHLKRPLFYKADSDARRQLAQLKQLQETAPGMMQGDGPFASSCLL